MALYQPLTLKLWTHNRCEEMLAITVYMGGGPGLMYASEALAAWDAFAPATEEQA